MYLGGSKMKNFDSRTYSINDFLEWQERGQLEISPKFQRRSVWSPQAKSYLIDTILRDKPLPKIFIRATTDPKTKKTIREIVDGQQRIRTILSFMQDGFRISKVHNEEFGGMQYSDLPESVQGEFLKYELSVDLLLGVQDRDILDVFARLNTYSVSLNRQELLNARYFGYFKQLVYKISSDFYAFWMENRIFTDTRIMRMGEAELVTDLVIAALDGIQSKRSASKYYARYDEVFDNRKEIEAKVISTLDLIGNLLGDTLSTSSFRTTPNFYGLFVALYHMNYGIPGLDLPRKPITEKDFSKIRHAIDEINCILDTEESSAEYFDFVKSTKDATTDVPARTTRCTFIIEHLYHSIND